MYTAYVLPETERQRLAKIFKPRYAEFLGHHVTEKFGVPKGTEAPPQPVKFRVVGEVDSRDGLQALVVSVDGSTERPDGGTYHITWSLDRDAGYKPQHSNDLIKATEVDLIRGMIFFDAKSEVLR